MNCARMLASARWNALRAVPCKSPSRSAASRFVSPKTTTPRTSSVCPWQSGASFSRSATSSRSKLPATGRPRSAGCLTSAASSGSSSSGHGSQRSISARPRWCSDITSRSVLRARTAATRRTRSKLMRPISAVSARDIAPTSSPGSAAKWISRRRQIRSSAGHMPHQMIACASCAQGARRCTASTSTA